MAKEGFGLTKKYNQANPIYGYSDTETVMVDFDDTPLRVVKNFALRALEFHKLDGFIILKSSENSYHVVFDRPVKWSENMRIIAWLSLISKNEKLKMYLVMQCIKQSSTLRISQKGKKPAPRIVNRFGKQNMQIKKFVAYRKQVKEIEKKIVLLN